MCLAFPQAGADRIGAVYFLARLAIARSRLLSVHRCLQCANVRFDDQCPRHRRHCNRCPAVSLEPVAIKPSYRYIGGMRSALNTAQTMIPYTIGAAAPDEPWQQAQSTHRTDAAGCGCSRKAASAKVRPVITTSRATDHAGPLRASRRIAVSPVPPLCASRLCPIIMGTGSPAEWHG